MLTCGDCSPAFSALAVVSSSHCRFWRRMARGRPPRKKGGQASNAVHNASAIHCCRTCVGKRHPCLPRSGTLRCGDERPRCRDGAAAAGPCLCARSMEGAPARGDRTGAPRRASVAPETTRLPRVERTPVALPDRPMSRPVGPWCAPRAGERRQRRRFIELGGNRARPPTPRVQPPPTAGAWAPALLARPRSVGDQQQKIKQELPRRGAGRRPHPARRRLPDRIPAVASRSLWGGPAVCRRVPPRGGAPRLRRHRPMALSGRRRPHLCPNGRRPPHAAAVVAQRGSGGVGAPSPRTERRWPRRPPAAATAVVGMAGSRRRWRIGGDAAVAAQAAAAATGMRAAAPRVHPWDTPQAQSRSSGLRATGPCRRVRRCNSGAATRMAL